jgi:hypothetical protein
VHKSRAYYKLYTNTCTQTIIHEGQTLIH